MTCRSGAGRADDQTARTFRVRHATELRLPDPCPQLIWVSLGKRPATSGRTDNFTPCDCNNYTQIVTG
jgi:hypothetical protein